MKTVEEIVNIDLQDGWRISKFNWTGTFLALVGFTKEGEKEVFARLDLGKCWFIDKPPVRPTVDQTIALVTQIQDCNKPIVKKEWKEVQFERAVGGAVRETEDMSVQQIVNGLVPIGAKYRVVKVTRKGPKHPKWKINK